MSGPKVIIIGAGVVGAALADELSLKGWDQITVVDQGSLPMPGGSSSHAPGMVFQNHASKAMSQMAQYTVEKFLTAEFDGLAGFQQTGGLEIATTPERLAELRRRHGWAKAWGLDARLISSAECVELQPLLDGDQVLGGLYTPNDGAARAVVAVNAQLQSAAARGVKILDRHEVIAIPVENGRVTGVETDHGFLAADIVVCCAGIWGPKIGAMVGMTLPMTAMEHQMAWTPPLPSQQWHTEEATRPMIRHMDAGIYYRDRFQKLEIGSFAHRAIPVDAWDLKSPDEAPVMPSVHPFTPEDFEPQWADTQKLMPETRETVVEDGYNGIMAFTPDDFPLLGPSPEVEGFWVAEGVWVTHSAGVGLAMAEWLVEGRSSTFSLHECEVSRFDRHQLSPSYIEELDVLHYIEVYDIKHSLEPIHDPRSLRTSPFYPRQQELGAVFLEGTGWERPHWYEANAQLVEGRDIPQFEGWTSQHWNPIIAAEAQYTREHVALYDMTPLRHLEVSGPDAETFLQGLTTANVAKSIGSVTYCLLLDETGGIRSDVTVTRLAANKYQIGANGPIDLAWLRTHIGQLRVTVEDVTSGYCCIGLWGPKARDLVTQLPSTIDFSGESFKYFRAKQGYLGYVPVTALRVSYVGELGWEIYTTADMGLQLWDSLMRAGEPYGVIAAGRGAFASLRLEKGYRAFGTDMTFEHDPYEVGLGFAVKAKEAPYIGSAALPDRRERSRRRLVCLTHSDTRQLLLGGEPVYAGHGGDAESKDAVGYVTSAGYGYTVGSGIAYAWLPIELAETGQAITISGYDRPIEATVTDEPLFDPSMQRLRG